MTNTDEVRIAGGAFLVQHHLATADHVDFRLQIGSTLASWAVPKGPSRNPAHRRPAIRTRAGRRPLACRTKACTAGRALAEHQ
jgi:hypothetical protein